MSSCRATNAKRKRAERDKALAVALVRDEGATVAEAAAKVKPREGVAFTVETFDDGIVALIRRIVYAAGGDDRTPLHGIEVSLAPTREAAP